MKTTNEIQSASKNIRYYSQQIRTLTKAQFDADVSLNNINAKVGTIRFDALADIAAACQWLDTYCDNIESNLRTAESQDKLLMSVDKEEQDEG